MDIGFERLYKYLDKELVDEVAEIKISFEDLNLRFGGMTNKFSHIQLNKNIYNKSTDTTTKDLAEELTKSKNYNILFHEIAHKIGFLSHKVVDDGVATPYGYIMENMHQNTSYKDALEQSKKTIDEKLDVLQTKYGKFFSEKGPITGDNKEQNDRLMSAWQVFRWYLSPAKKLIEYLIENEDHVIEDFLNGKLKFNSHNYQITER